MLKFNKIPLSSFLLLIHDFLLTFAKGFNLGHRANDRNITFLIIKFNDNIKFLL